MPTPSSYTMPALLAATVTAFPDHEIRHIRADKSVHRYTYRELLDHALRLLGGFQEHGLQRGDNLILSLDTTEEIIPVLWAAFFGGIVPALLQPPVTFSEYNPAAEKARNVFSVLENPWVVFSHKHAGSWQQTDIGAHHLIDLQAVYRKSKPPEIPELHPDDLALIQFSSGSTGDPKGVMLSHRNIYTNIADIRDGILLTPQDVSVSWMPLYHDMGLIGFHITPTMVGCVQHFIEPVDFVKNPGLYLDTMNEYKCNITGCPNFGQILLNRYLHRKTSSGDLSSVRVVFNGAEPISVPVMREFISLLQPFGFRPEAMFPAYGMAEATLAVTFASLTTEPEVVTFNRTALLRSNKAIPAGPGETDGIELVNLGKPLKSCELRIVDEHLQPVEENRIGQLLVRGDNITGGYYHNPAFTSETIVQGWLLTGDLGFLHEGNLFVTGRLKDVIFINGINLYAHDLEHLAVKVEGISFGRVVMSGYFDESEGRDKVAVFLVTPGNAASVDLFRAVQQQFLSSAGLLIDTFIPIRSADIPRTSSGKIQRYKLINRFLQGDFRVIRLPGTP